MRTKIVVGLAALVLAMSGTGCLYKKIHQNDNLPTKEPATSTVLKVHQPEPCASEMRLQMDYERDSGTILAIPVVYCKDKDGRELVCGALTGNSTGQTTFCYTLE